MDDYPFLKSHAVSKLNAKQICSLKIACCLCVSYLLPIIPFLQCIFFPFFFTTKCFNKILVACIVCTMSLFQNRKHKLSFKILVVGLAEDRSANSFDVVYQEFFFNSCIFFSFKECTWFTVIFPWFICNINP